LPEKRTIQIWGSFDMDKMKKIGLLGAAALIGAGLAALSEERIREFVKETVEAGKISKEEGKILVDDLVSETKKQRLSLEKNIIGKLQSSIKMADRELADLSDKIDEMKIKELEAELERMRSLRKANK
jgi:polyhydroxyalkanoate synthesis regulator phasin